ncbi:MAG: gliding motility-associated C-terminal domain-containing protein [Bacteroidia bacterium]
MKKEEDKLEKTFREKLDDYKVPVAASAWAGIEAALGNATTSVAGSISTLFYAAAIVGSVVFTTAVVSHNYSEDKKSDNNKEISVAENGNNLEAAEAENINTEETETLVDDFESNTTNNKKQVKNISTDLSGKKREKYIVKDLSLGTDNKNEATVKVEKIPENTLFTKLNASVSGGFAPLRVSFEHESSSGTKVRWNFGDKSESFVNEPTHTYYRAGSYKVTILITDKYGNTATDYKYVEVKEGSDLRNVSSVITPNDDDRNDEVALSYKNIVEFSMVVYNSSSKKVFETENIEKLWRGYDQKGKVQPNGNYVYVIKAKGVDGKEYDLRGQITVLQNYRP